MQKKKKKIVKFFILYYYFIIFLSDCNYLQYLFKNFIEIMTIRSAAFLVCRFAAYYFFT